MTSTYALMCSNKRIQDALKWRPKYGDIVVTPDDRQSIVVWIEACTGFITLYLEGRGYKRYELIWLPRVEDWLEMLSGELWKVTHYRKTKGHGDHFVLYLDDNGRDHSEAEFYGSDLNQIYCQAFMWTQGLKWENNQWERS